MGKVRNSHVRRRAIQHGYRSGLEDKVADQLALDGMGFEYEKHVIKYEQPAKNRKYTPDFVLDNGIVIETKGRLTAEDRHKHVWIKDQYPDLEIRFVFTNSKGRLYKGSKSTYADWCKQYGFQYADKLIPPAWLEESSVNNKILSEGGVLWEK